MTDPRNTADASETPPGPHPAATGETIPHVDAELVPSARPDAKKPRDEPESAKAIPKSRAAPSWAMLRTRNAAIAGAAAAIVVAVIAGWALLGQRAPSIQSAEIPTPAESSPAAASDFAGSEPEPVVRAASKIANAGVTDSKKHGISTIETTSSALPPPPTAAFADDEQWRSTKSAFAQLGSAAAASGERSIEASPSSEESERGGSATLPSPDERALADMQAQLEAARIEAARQSAEISALRTALEQVIAEREQAARENSTVSADQIRQDSPNDFSLRMRSAAASLAFAALDRAVASGRPFEAELVALAQLAPSDPSIETLKRISGAGAPTLAELRRDFPAAARASRAADANARSSGWIGGLVAQLELIASIRPAAPLAGDSVAAIISRAEHRLERERLDEAVNEIERLSGPAREAMEEWVGAARARLDAESAVARLNSAVLSELTD